MATRQKKRGFALFKKTKLKEVARKGGLSAQKSRKVHKLTASERSRGGKKSSGNFKYRSQRAAKQAGRKGGSKR